MPMKVTFELSDRDLRQLRALVAETTQRHKAINEKKIIAGVLGMIEQMRQQKVPDFVRQRVEKLESLIEMLHDGEWAMPAGDRKRIVAALAYFAEPEDLIPDQIPGLGFLDDAIIVELVVRDLRPELDAYADFCKFRRSKSKLLGKATDPTARTQWLDARRQQLHSRMRRRRRSGVSGSASVKLW